ncbi:unnamed protein product [Leuciscus chuanchicus]
MTEEVGEHSSDMARVAAFMGFRAFTTSSTAVLSASDERSHPDVASAVVAGLCPVQTSSAHGWSQRRVLSPKHRCDVENSTTLNPAEAQDLCIVWVWQTALRRSLVKAAARFVELWLCRGR